LKTVLYILTSTLDKAWLDKESIKGSSLGAVTPTIVQLCRL